MKRKQISSNVEAAITKHNKCPSICPVNLMRHHWRWRRYFGVSRRLARGRRVSLTAVSKRSVLTFLEPQFRLSVLWTLFICSSTVVFTMRRSWQTFVIRSHLESELRVYECSYDFYCQNQSTNGVPYATYRGNGQK